MKIRQSIKIVVISFLLAGVSFAGDWEYGFGLKIGVRGYGITSNVSRNFGNTLRAAAKFGIMDVVAEDEIRGTNYYGRPIVYNDPRIITIPVLITGTYFPFYGKIENNFSPYVVFGGGAQYVMDGEDGNATFFDNVSSAEKYFSPGLYFGAGVEFYMSPVMDVNVSVGYEYMPLDESNIDGLKNMNGLMINLDFMFEI